MFNLFCSLCQLNQLNHVSSQSLHKLTNLCFGLKHKWQYLKKDAWTEWCTHKYTISSFNLIHTECVHEDPPLLTHPGWHLLNTHAQYHTLMETDAVHWSGGQPFTGSLAQGHLGCGEEVDRHPSSCQFQSLSSESGNRTANLQVIGRHTLTTEPRPPPQSISNQLIDLIFHVSDIIVKQNELQL